MRSRNTHTGSIYFRRFREMLTFANYSAHVCTFTHKSVFVVWCITWNKCEQCLHAECVVCEYIARDILINTHDGW